jgi:uncharacterized protein YgbK (DUF1537 family)
MIAVIADDFTGAAEIGGIGLRHGLRVMIETSVEKVDDIDLLIIATNTRSLNEEEASKEIDKIVKKLLILEPTFIFKKLDSVLRGNVNAELHAQMKASGKNLAVVVAGNPYFKRIIKNGIYYIEDIPLAETSFGNDPEYSINSSSVVDLLSSSYLVAKSARPTDELPKSGLIIGDITNDVEMKKWSHRLDNNMVVAGGAGFFDSLLCGIFGVEETNHTGRDYTFGRRSLFVFGSAYPKPPDMDGLTLNNNISVFNMPDEIFNNANYDSKCMQTWIANVVDALKKDKSVFVSIKHKFCDEEGLSVRLTKMIGEFVAGVIKSVELNDLFIEGGATASAVFNYLEIKRLLPFGELEPGIIQMNPVKYPNLKVTTKPGSYKWPKNKIHFIKN